VGVVEEVVSGLLTGGEAAVVALFHYILLIAKVQGRAALEDEDVFLLGEMVMEFV
jgi:hypothetical protein